LGARDLSHQWKPTLIDQQMVFASEFTAIGRVSACVLASGRCRYACSVNASSIPHDLVVLAEPSKYRLVDTLPNAG
jgi:ferredoxin